MSSLDEKIRGSSIREEAIRAIRAAIIYGELAPGEMCSAPALASRLGVSITPVREAMLELASRGMVTAIRNRGFRVVEYTAADLNEATELRGFVEVPMMARLADFADRETVLEFTAVAQEGVEAVRAGDLPRFIELDRRFHLGLLSKAGNSQVAELVARLKDQMRYSMVRDHRYRAWILEVAQGHLEIIDAIGAGDATATARHVRSHLKLGNVTWENDRRHRAE